MSKVVILSGSHRKDPQSFKVAQYLQKRLRDNYQTESEIINLAEVEIPLWDEGVWENTEKWQKVWGPLAEKLKAAEGLITIAPEWAGMVPPGVKNFFLLCTPKEIGHKPNMLVGVSASRGGAYPIAELRSSGYKNNKMLHIPDHLIVRDVNDVMNEGEAANDSDTYIRERADWTLGVLLTYMEALTPLRQANADLLYKKKYSFGM